VKKLAFIKFGGLASGGTEVSFQNVASALSKNYQVDYFYCDSAPYIGSNWIHPDTDKSRKKFLEESKVNLIKFNVEKKDVTHKEHIWINTNFWKKFKEEKYSLIFATGAGHPEYPFTKIRTCPIVYIVTINAGVFNQSNIVKTILISNDSAKKWSSQGGNLKNSLIIPLVREEIPKSNIDLRKNLGLQDKFIFGFHQRTDDTIFSDIPLKAYKKIESRNNFFLMLGGSSLYKKQAEKLKLNNFIQLESSGSTKTIDTFLNTLNVFTHGRKYGETFGLVLTEAMSYGLPLISHRAESNAQVELISNVGRVFHKKNYFSYYKEMKKLQLNNEYYKTASLNSLNKYKNNYSPETTYIKYKNLVEELLG
jgi:glycosyltransferase involved in cell wall biosynthesis